MKKVIRYKRTGLYTEDSTLALATTFPTLGEANSLKHGNGATILKSGIRKYMGLRVNPTSTFEVIKDTDSGENTYRPVRKSHQVRRKAHNYIEEGISAGCEKIFRIAKRYGIDVPEDCD